MKNTDTYAPDWTNYGESFEEFLNRIEKNMPMKRCYSCTDNFHEDDLIEGICLTCNNYNHGMGPE